MPQDHNLVHPEFIEMVNALLAAGEVPGLYAPEELPALLAPLQEECGAEGFTGGPDPAPSLPPAKGTHCPHSTGREGGVGGAPPRSRGKQRPLPSESGSRILLQAG